MKKWDIFLTDTTSSQHWEPKRISLSHFLTFWKKMIWLDWTVLTRPFWWCKSTFFRFRLKSVVAVWHSPKPLAVNKDDGCGADLTNGFIQICFGSFIITGSLSSSRRWLAFKRLYYNAGLFKRIPDRNSRLEQHYRDRVCWFMLFLMCWDG